MSVFDKTCQHGFQGVFKIAALRGGLCIMPVYTFCLSDFWISDPFSTLRGALFGIWISDFRVLDFEEGGADDRDQQL